MDSYQIKFREKTVGSADVIVEGLYYKICCHCQIPKSGMYRIYVVGDRCELDLGICVPVADTYTLVKRIPKKQIGNSLLSFYVREKTDTKFTNEFAVYEDRPFEHIDQLDKCRIKYENNKPYLIIMDQL